MKNLQSFGKLLESHGFYHRVIPRDFFNEAKLLKCMGQLQLKIHGQKLPDGIDISIEESGEPFNIEQDGGDGGIYVSNYPTTVNGHDVTFKTPLNSKAAYPLLCVTEDDEEFLVFDEKGEFTEEFEKITSVLKDK